MVVFSKYLPDFTCYELAHTTEPSCLKSWLLLACYSGLSSLKIYTTLYLLSGLISGRLATYLKTRFLTETLQSTAFLSCNATLFLLAFCALRFLTGRMFYLMPFMGGLVASYFALGVERISKRSALAAYTCMISAEGLFNALKDKGYVRSIPKGEIAILAVALFWLSSLAPLKSAQGQQLDTASFVMRLLSSVPRNERWRHLLSKISNGAQNENHAHPSDMSCLSYVFDGVVRGGLAGLALDLFFMMRGRHGKSGHVISGFAKLFSSSLVQFSLLLFVFRTLLCNSAKLLPNLDAVLRRSLVAFISSFVFASSKMRATIPLWLFFKAAQLTCGNVASGMSPLASDQVTRMFYAVSTAYLLHQGVMEAHNMRPSYWEFLVNLTGNIIGHVNRTALCGFQEGANRMDPVIHGCPNWWPRYDPAASSQWTGPTAIPSFILPDTDS